MLRRHLPLMEAVAEELSMYECSHMSKEISPHNSIEILPLQVPAISSMEKFRFQLSSESVREAEKD